MYDDRRGGNKPDTMSRLGLYKIINLLHRSKKKKKGRGRDVGGSRGGATGNLEGPGCSGRGSRRTGCSTGSTGSGSGSTAATAEHTERKTSQLYRQKSRI